MTHDFTLMRELVKKVMLQHHYTAEEVAGQTKVELSTINNFISGRVTSPYGNTMDALDLFVKRHGMTRGGVLAAIKQADAPPPPKWVPEPMAIRDKLVEIRTSEYGGSPKKLADASGLPYMFVYAIDKTKGSMMTKNFKAAKVWLQKIGKWQGSIPPSAGEEDAEQKILEDIGFKNTGQAGFSSQEIMKDKHYICAYLSKIEKEQLVSSILNNCYHSSSSRLSLLGKIFSVDIPEQIL